jgi:hypothetical protein
MEYITLNKLVNKYPTVGNYVAKVAGSIKLNGIFPKKNFIDFQISPINNIKLDDIKAIDNTKFKFVLGVKNKSSETTPFKYFTSPDFFKNLQDSINEPNPYFVLQALKKEFIVEYSLEDDINTLKDLVKLEKEDSVELKNHLWFLEDGTIDYKKLVQYIDWVVSTPTEVDSANLGVIPVSEILTKADYKIEKLKLEDLPTSATESSGGSSNPYNNATNDVFTANNEGSGGGATGGGSSYNPGQAGTTYSGRPGDFSSGNANYTGNQYDQFPNQYGG